MIAKIIFSTALCVLLIDYARSAEKCSLVVPKLASKPICNAFTAPGLTLTNLCTTGEETASSKILNSISKIKFNFSDKHNNNYNLQYYGRDAKTINYKITEQGKNETVGLVDLELNSLFEASLELEININEKYRGKGIGTRSLIELHKVIRNQNKTNNLNIKYLVSIILPDNKASIAVHEKLNPSSTCQHIVWLGKEYIVFFYDMSYGQQ